MLNTRVSIDALHSHVARMRELQEQFWRLTCAGRVAASASTNQEPASPRETNSAVAQSNDASPFAGGWTPEQLLALDLSAVKFCSASGPDAEEPLNPSATTTARTRPSDKSSGHSQDVHDFKEFPQAGPTRGGVQVAMSPSSPDGLGVNQVSLTAAIPKKKPRLDIAAKFMEADGTVVSSESTAAEALWSLAPSRWPATTPSTFKPVDRSAPGRWPEAKPSCFAPLDQELDDEESIQLALAAAPSFKFTPPPEAGRDTNFFALPCQSNPFLPRRPTIRARRRKATACSLHTDTLGLVMTFLEPREVARASRCVSS